VVHKATVMPETDGVFVAAAREVARAEFPELEVDDRLMDAVCHELATAPRRCDVLLAPVLYGDLLSDLCAGLAGGLGLALGVSLGEDCAVFEAVHGTAPRLAGRDRANPMAAMLCGAMLLRHLDEDDAADRLERAVAAVVAAGRQVTYDLRSDRDEARAAGTIVAADAVVAAVRA
jgi:isocitrate dehydrogenase (NAD+)